MPKAQSPTSITPEVALPCRASRISTCTPSSSLVLVSFLLIGAFWQTKVDSGPGVTLVPVHDGGAVQKRHGHGRVVRSTVHVELCVEGVRPLFLLYFAGFLKHPNNKSHNPPIPCQLRSLTVFHPCSSCMQLFSCHCRAGGTVSTSFPCAFSPSCAFLNFKLWEMLLLLRRVDLFPIFCLQNQMANFLGYSRDTVAVAINYFDRYTCARPCNATLAQAVAATALHVAAKFEESSPASLVRWLNHCAVSFARIFTRLILRRPHEPTTSRRGCIVDTEHSLMLSIVVDATFDPRLLFS